MPRPSRLGQQAQQMFEAPAASPETEAPTPYWLVCPWLVLTRLSLASLDPWLAD